MRNNDVAMKRGRFCCSNGNNIHVLYAPVVNPDGTIHLEATGTEDTDEIIESYASSCSLEAILNRFKNGDQRALNVNVPMFLDLTEFPRTYAEVLQLGIDAELQFNKLPLDVRKEWNNNWREWLAQTGTEAWFKSFGIDVKNGNTEESTSDQEGEDK